MVTHQSTEQNHSCLTFSFFFLLLTNLFLYFLHILHLVDILLCILIDLYNKKKKRTILNAQWKFFIFIKFLENPKTENEKWKIYLTENKFKEI